MAFVLQTDASLAEAGVVYDFSGTPQSDLWISFDIYIDADSLAEWVAGPASPLLIDMGIEGLGITSGGWVTNWAPAAGTPVAGVFLSCEVHHTTSGVSEFYIGGSLVTSGAVGSALDMTFLGVGQFFGFGPYTPSLVYHANIKIGTTRGGSEIFADDFADGTLDAWTSVVGDASLVTYPFPGPPTRIFVDQTWRIFVTSMESRTLTILDKRVSDGTFMFPFKAPAVHSGSVASDDPEINIAWPDPTDPANLTNNRRLIFALRREAGSPPYECRFGGIIMSVEDQGTDIPVTRYTAYDPWQYLMSRPVRNPYTGELPDQRTGLVFPAGSLASDIALLLLEATETVDGDTHVDLTDLSLVEDTEPLPADITFDAGLSVGEAWNQLVETGTIDIALPPIYDPIARPGKVCMFQCASMLGQVRFGAVMSWDRSIRTVMNLSRLVDGTRLANRVQWFGANGQAVALQSAGTSIAENGEYWAQQFFPDARDADLLDLGALAQLLIRRNGERTVNIDVAPEAPELALRDYKPGDWLPVWASRNLREPLAVDYDAYNSDPDNPGAAGYMRIQAIPISLDDNGVETVPGLVLSKDGAGSGP